MHCLPDSALFLLVALVAVAAVVRSRMHYTPLPLLGLLALLAAAFGLVPLPRAQTVVHALLGATIGAAIVHLQVLAGASVTVAVLPCLFLSGATILSFFPAHAHLAPFLYLAFLLASFGLTAFLLYTRPRTSHTISVTLTPTPPSPASSRTSLQSHFGSPIIKKSFKLPSPHSHRSSTLHILILTATQLSSLIATSFSIPSSLLYSSPSQTTPTSTPLVGAIVSAVTTHHIARPDVFRILDTTFTVLAILCIVGAYWYRTRASSPPDLDIEHGTIQISGIPTIRPPPKAAQSLTKSNTTTPMTPSPSRVTRLFTSLSPSSPTTTKKLIKKERYTHTRALPSSSSSFFSPRPKRTPLPVPLPLVIRRSTVTVREEEGKVMLIGPGDDDEVGEEEDEKEIPHLDLDLFRTCPSASTSSHERRSSFPSSECVPVRVTMSPGPERRATLVHRNQEQVKLHPDETGCGCKKAWSWHCLSSPASSSSAPSPPPPPPSPSLSPSPSTDDADCTDLRDPFAFAPRSRQREKVCLMQLMPVLPYHPRKGKGNINASAYRGYGGVRPGLDVEKRGSTSSLLGSGQERELRRGRTKMMSVWGRLPLPLPPAYAPALRSSTQQSHLCPSPSRSCSRSIRSTYSHSPQQLGSLTTVVMGAYTGIPSPESESESHSYLHPSRAAPRPPPPPPTPREGATLLGVRSHLPTNPHSPPSAFSFRPQPSSPGLRPGTPPHPDLHPHVRFQPGLSDSRPSRAPSARQRFRVLPACASPAQSPPPSTVPGGGLFRTRLTRAGSGVGKAESAGSAAEMRLLREKEREDALLAERLLERLSLGV